MKGEAMLKIFNRVFRLRINLICQTESYSLAQYFFRVINTLCHFLSRI